MTLEKNILFSQNKFLCFYFFLFCFNHFYIFFIGFKFHFYCHQNIKFYFYYIILQSVTKNKNINNYQFDLLIHFFSFFFFLYFGWFLEIVKITHIPLLVPTKLVLIFNVISFIAYEGAFFSQRTSHSLIHLSVLLSLSGRFLNLDLAHSNIQTSVSKRTLKINSF